MIHIIGLFNIYPFPDEDISLYIDQANSFEEAVDAIHSMNPQRPKEQIKDRLSHSMYQVRFEL